MDYKKIIKENMEKLEEINNKKSQLWQTIRENRDKARTTWGEYEKIYKEIITPAEKQNELETIKKAIIYNNFAYISQELFKNEFLPKLTQFKNKNIGEKTRDKINGILQDILQAQGLKVRCYYNLMAFHNSNDLTFKFLLLDAQGYTYGNDSEFLSLRLEIPTSFHLFDKIEEATTDASDHLQLVKVEQIDNTAAHLKIQHDLLVEEIDKTIKKLATKRTDYQNLLTKNLCNLKNLEIDYKVNLY